MKVLVTGQSGFVGRHVVALLLNRGDQVFMLPAYQADAMIHLAWNGLPNYESEAHFSNVEWQFEMISDAAKHGLTNITVAGTCLEVVANPPAYARAKLELHRLLKELPIELKWLRLPYLYGEGQPEHCLLPSLQRAIARGDRQFHVAPTSKVFMDVSEAAWCLCNATKLHEGGVFDFTDKTPETVEYFCRYSVPAGAIELVEDYPLASWEQ